MIKKSKTDLLTYHNIPISHYQRILTLGVRALDPHHQFHQPPKAILGMPVPSAYLCTFPHIPLGREPHLSPLSLITTVKSPYMPSSQCSKLKTTTTLFHPSLLHEPCPLCRQTPDLATKYAHLHNIRTNPFQRGRLYSTATTLTTLQTCILCFQTC